ncbi:hypothetical protein AGLY_002907 [Aphis glycines]|uniref:Uncharacterized protein n=1 Tax=Aphis glycines TaxID=307491 RepID=A0A6G0U445_APHGL|nr:hypothetical protein AGLY_002907 [Aphis glycines]
MDKLMIKKCIEDDNKAISLFEIPSRVLVVGAFGCDQPVYKKLKKIFNGISSINIHFFDDDIISVDDCEPNSVVVIDDFLLENQKKKNKFIEEPSETAETQKKFKKGTNLENETEKMKQLIHLQQNLQKNFKKSDLEHSEKKLNVIKKDEDEDEGDNNNACPIQGHVEYTPKKIQKIINLKKNLQNNYRKTVLNDKYTAEEKVKHYEPILKALSNVESSVNDVKEVAIKTDNDIQKMIISPYKPKNPELHRLMSAN